MTALDVPAPVARSEIAAFCARLGFEATRLQSLEIRTLGIYATVHATNDEGRQMYDGVEVAVHRIFVPIVDDEAP